MKIGIIGYGVVGKAIENTMKKQYTIIKYDKFNKLDNFNRLLECQFVFISVPTPFDCQKNIVDDSAIHESLHKLSDIKYKNMVIVKSTVAPGMCDSYADKYDLNIVFNPEFLRESTTPNEDFENQHIVVIGSDNITNYNLTKSMFHKVLLPDIKYYHTTCKEAEMVKSAQNTMLASRVAISNMIYDGCKENGVDYNKIREIAFNPFDIIGPNMTLVPGPDGKRGFGGKCLPKDIRGFSTVYSSNLLKEIIEYNDTLRDDLGNFLDNWEK
jgi:nucleotide sugar dehydrogenase